MAITEEMENENLYFIALVPPKEICDEITGFKLDFKDHYKAKVKLNVMPHITLKAPFNLTASRHLELKKWFQELDFNFGPFQIYLKGFGAFHNPKKSVVYVNPVSDLSFFSLQKEIIRRFHISYPSIKIREQELIFKPHMTVAYLDPAHNKFLEAWELYKKKEYVASFKADSFYLLQHKEKEWKIIDTCALVNTSPNSA